MRRFLSVTVASLVALVMDNCFGGLTSPFPTVITMAGTFLWICKKIALK